MELLPTTLNAVVDALSNDPVIECNFKKQFLSIICLHTYTEMGVIQVIHCSYYIFHIFSFCSSNKEIGDYRVSDRKPRQVMARQVDGS